MKQEKLLQRVMSQHLLVVGDKHIGDENDHLIESETTMNSVYQYISVLHDSGYKYRLWLESGNTYKEALINFGFDVNHLPLQTIRPIISHKKFEAIQSIYDKIRTSVFVDKHSNHKSSLILDEVRQLDDQKNQLIRYWMKTFIVSIEDEAKKICAQRKTEDVIDIIVIGNIHAHYLSTFGYPVLCVEDDELFMQYAFINKTLREYYNMLGDS